MSIDIDEKTITPADYTVCVKNIPVDLEVDYHDELKKIFENSAVLDSSEAIIVEKIVLIYDIDEIIEME